MKKLILIGSLLFVCLSAFSQGGAQLFSGLVIADNKNLSITNSGEYHSGYTIGLQTRLKDGTFVAGPGLKYTRINMFSAEETEFFSSQESYHFIQVPINIGLEYKVGNILKIRPYIGADATYFYKIDDNSHEINYDYVKDYFFGAHAGMGIDLWWITLDVIYEKGLSDAHAFGNSPYNFLSVNLGFFF